MGLIDSTVLIRSEDSTSLHTLSIKLYFRYFETHNKNYTLYGKDL